MKKDQSLAGKLHQMENGISGVRNNPEIQERMSMYGYTPEQVEEVARLHSRQLSETGAAQQSGQDRDRAMTYSATDTATSGPSPVVHCTTNCNGSNRWGL